MGSKYDGITSNDSIVKELRSKIDKLLDDAELYKKELDEHFNSIDKILKIRQELIDEAKKLNKAVKVLEGKTEYLEYVGSWSWKEKILYVLKSKKTFTPFKEILDVVGNQEARFDDLKERSKINSALRVTLSRLIDSNEIIRIYENEIAFYGLPVWLDKKDRVIDMYKNISSKYKIK